MIKFKQAHIVLDYNNDRPFYNKTVDYKISTSVYSLLTPCYMKLVLMKWQMQRLCK